MATAVLSSAVTLLGDASFRMAASPPDVLIEFPQDIASTFDFHRANELIAKGREKAAKAFDAAGL